MAETVKEKQTESAKKDMKKYYHAKVKVVVPLTQKNQADEIVGVNGVQYAIKPGVEVEVPRYIALALERKRKAKERAFLTESGALKNFSE